MNAKQIIDSLGGTLVLVKKLGWDDFNGQRRINNWKRRGIPFEILLKYPKLFKGYKR